MTGETALIAAARPAMLLAKLHQVERTEFDKGCRRVISVAPVALEPFYRPIASIRELVDAIGQPHEVLEPTPSADELARFRVWASPAQELDWHRSERFLKLLVGVRRRITLDVVGNQTQVHLVLLHHRDDAPVVTAAFQGEMSPCVLTPFMDDPLVCCPAEAWAEMEFLDFYPPPSYANSLTCPDELKTSPYEPLITAVAMIAPPAIGLYQAVFQPANPANDWHRNVRVLQDLEYLRRQMDGTQLPLRYTQQPPSGSLQQMAEQLRQKAHNDKPFFTLALRVAVIGAGEAGGNLLRALAVPCSFFQHGGRPLEQLTVEDYKRILTPLQIREMFLLGLTYRPGFLVNSFELAGPVHIPAMGFVRERRLPMELLPTPSILPKALSEGTPVGTTGVSGMAQLVCIPDPVRRLHIHIIGQPAQGKSTLIEKMVEHDVKTNHGLALIDPHGDLAERILRVIPEDQLSRVIYLEFGDRDHVPIWNPFHTVPGQDLVHTASNLVGVLKTFETGWGHRLEHLLRNGIYAVLHLPDGTLRQVSDLLQYKSDLSAALRHDILERADDPALRHFLIREFDRYRDDDFAPVQHKLGHLLTGGTVARMLSQPESSFSLREVMDNGMLLLINLSGLSGEVRDVLGCLFLALLHSTALTRSDTPAAKRRPFRVYCDEAHRFMTDAMEDLIAETQKFGISLTLAHQYLGQFQKKKADALASTATTIIFNVITVDAGLLAQNLQGTVEARDLSALERFEAVLRCGKEIVRIRTLPPVSVGENDLRDRIVAESRRKYYIPANALTASAMSWRGHDASHWRWSSSLANAHEGPAEEFLFDDGF